jgi:hypothetical protein
MKPQKKCQIKIKVEMPSNKKEKTGFYFFAPKEVADQMKEFGGVLRIGPHEFWELHSIDPRYDYEEIKAYLLSLEPTIGKNDTNESRWNKVEHHLDQFKADVLDCKRYPEFSRYWGCMSRCQSVLWALLNFIRDYDSTARDMGWQR